MFSFVLFQSQFSDRIISSLYNEKSVDAIYIIQPKKNSPPMKSSSVNDTDKIHYIKSDQGLNKKAFLDIIEYCTSPYFFLFNTDQMHFTFNYLALKRFNEIIHQTNAKLLYSNYYETLSDGEQILNRLCCYQAGSVREDFDFGPLMLFETNQVRTIIQTKFPFNIDYNILYYLRLQIQLQSSIIQVPEPLYSIIRPVKKGKGELSTLFKYQSKEDQSNQQEQEKIFTHYLKQINAYLPPPQNDLPSYQPEQYPVTASVIIPVKNREKTIADAVNSALSQQCSFPFNIIVVDNHSSDNTTKILQTLTQKHPNLHHIIPEERNLGIGGCWNIALHYSKCGLYAVQLDSDDLYNDDSVLDQLVTKLQSDEYAMVIGSYQLVDKNLNPLNFDLITHKEWTYENGHNNAIRINGLGAPRAFFVPILKKEVTFPNVSYGEDYYVGLALSRSYKIGRIYENLYLCRRWEDNTDALLSVDKKKEFNEYKDWIRTLELFARQQKNLKNPDQTH